MLPIKTQLAFSILAVTTVLYTPSALADLKPYQATYTVIKSGLTLGTMNAQLSVNGANYQYNRDTQASGLAAALSGDRLTENVKGTLKGQTLQPQSYVYHHSSKRKDRKDEFRFTSPTSVQGAKNGEAYKLTIPAGTLDPSSMELSLVNDLSANRPLNYKVTEKGELRDYTFQKLGNEKVSVPAGDFDCIKLQIARSGNERQTTLWVAPSLNYAPVKIRHTEDGDSIESRLSSFNAR